MNAAIPIVVIVSGNLVNPVPTNDDKPLHSSNALAPIDVVVADTSTDVNDVLPLTNPSGITVTVAGNTTEVNAVLFANAELPIVASVPGRPLVPNEVNLVP